MIPNVAPMTRPDQWKLALLRLGREPSFGPLRLMRSGPTLVHPSTSRGANEGLGAVYPAAGPSRTWLRRHRLPPSVSAPARPNSDREATSIHSSHVVSGRAIPPVLSWTGDPGSPDVVCRDPGHAAYTSVVVGGLEVVVDRPVGQLQGEVAAGDVGEAEVEAQPDSGVHDVRPYCAAGVVVAGGVWVPRWR